MYRQIKYSQSAKLMTNLLTTYLELSGSTTRFLEAVSEASVHANIRSQHACKRTQTLERLSTLHVGDSNPILAAQCRLNLEALSDSEIKQLTETTHPIGAILLSTSEEGLRRESVTITQIDQHPLAELLDAGSGLIFSKSFELWQGSRFIGHLEEIVSEASIARVKLLKRAKMRWPENEASSL